MGTTRSTPQGWGTTRSTPQGSGTTQFTLQAWVILPPSKGNSGLLPSCSCQWLLHGTLGPSQCSHNSAFPAMVLVKGPVYLTVLNIIYGLVQLHPLPDVSAALTTAHTILASTKFVWHFSLLSSERLKCVGFLCQLFFLIFFILPPQGSWEVLEQNQECRVLPCESLPCESQTTGDAGDDQIQTIHSTRRALRTFPRYSHHLPLLEPFPSRQRLATFDPRPLAPCKKTHLVFQWEEHKYSAVVYVNEQE